MGCIIMDFNAETFKALGSKTRLLLIKYLSKRRMTQSELSKCTGLHVSSVKEHLDILTAAGIIERHDDGNKWKYYSLTTGVRRSLSNPLEISLILPLSLLFMVSGVFHFAYLNMVPKVSGALQASDSFFKTGAPEVAEAVMDSVVAKSPVVLNRFVASYPEISSVSVGLVIFGIFLFGVFIGLKIRENKIDKV
ncbi:MAG: ArsR family transcriptional regulator [Nanohaloarchaea archaeon]|nr:ArsR family transcriptional regulator [Candidatus Nanohaloarchaea archaeon]